MWWPGVIWIEYIFHVGFSAGRPSWQVLSLSDSTLEHHVISRWCQPQLCLLIICKLLFFWPTALWKCPFSLFALPGPSKKYGARGCNSLYKILLTYKFLIIGLHLRTGQCMLSVKYVFKHSRGYCLERCRFISQPEILWICHLEEWNLYMWVAGSILFLLGLLCNYFINWNMIIGVS